METMRLMASIAFVLLVAISLIGVAGIIADTTGLLDLYRAQTAARQAEAEAARLQAQADALRERQSFIQVLITSFASAKDSILVTITYILGGLALGLALIVIFVLLLDRARHKKDNPARYPEGYL